MIKIYYLIGTGYIIAGISETDHKGDHTTLTYPAQINMVNTAEGAGLQLTNVVAPFLKNYRGLMECFPIKDNMIIFSDEPGDDVVVHYKEWVANTKTKLSGIIQPVGGGSASAIINKGKGGGAIMTREEYCKIKLRLREFINDSKEMISSEDTHCMEDFCMDFVFDDQPTYEDLLLILDALESFAGWETDEEIGSL